MSIEKDLQTTEEVLPIIDCTKTTEDIQKAVDGDEDAEAARELAEMMGESVEEVQVLDEPEEITKFPLGYTYELKRPLDIARGNEVIKITEVCFDKELEGRHIAKMPMDMGTWKWSHYLSLVGACTGLHSSALMKLKTCDLPHLIEVASSFFANGPEIG